MRRFLWLFAGVLLIGVIGNAHHPAQSQQVYLNCQNSSGVFVPASPTNPCPTTATISGSVTATSAATAAATLPTLTAGSNPNYQSLSGGLYVQPIFGTTIVDATHGLPTNCIAGCSGGTASNASSGVATSSTNGTTNAWLYGFNGTTWDQLQVDGSKSLKINIASGSIANTSFAATQATAASLNATVVGTGTFAVQAAQSGTWNITNVSGTVSLPTGAATSANQTTAAAIGSTTSGQTGGLAMGAVTTSAPTYTTAQTDPLSLDTAGNLRVNVTTFPSNQSINLAQVNGVTTLAGAGASGTGAQRVTQSQDTTTLAGSAPGTAGSASSNVVTVQGVASMTPVQVSQATAANLLANVGGLAASGASVSGNPILNGGRAQNAEQTAVTNGQAVGLASDLVGKLIVSPYANKENFVGGTASVTGTSSTSLVAAPGANLFLYITAVSCFNSGSTLTTVAFQNGSGGTTIWQGVAAPTGGGFTHTFPVPIGGVNNMTANTALFIQAGSATTTLYCNASGYKGT